LKFGSRNKEVREQAVADTARRLGAVVRQARLARRWSQPELAAAAAVGLRTLRRIETGGVSPASVAWFSVLTALDLRLEVVNPPQTSERKRAPRH
jgi:ribosome-binding protein aMBF1 (putative translation factor)